MRSSFDYDKYQAGEGWRIYDVLLKTESGAFNIAQTKTIEGVVSQSSACISITDPSNLPIEWGEVTATAKENEFIRLDWNTITEENNLGFEIERYSEESDVFHQVSFVEGQGNSLEETDYVFDDSNVYPGVLYHYRIKQLDLNGDYNYSDIVSAKVDVTRLMVSVFPNPVLDGSLNLSITNPTDEADFKVEIFSSEGKLMQNSSYELAQNHQILNLDVSRLSKGMYIVRMSNFSFSQVEQLIIR
ncbi:MAG: T9SS type A sorting domain-containing protein [Saprospiraceae bacterium]